MNFRSILFSILAMSLASNICSAAKKSAAQLNLEVIDGLCVQNYEDFSNIEHMAKAFGGKEIPESLKKGDPAMRQLGGKSYMIPYEGTNYIVGYANGGGCTVISKTIDHAKLSQLLINNYGVRLVHSEQMGAQVSEMYQVIRSSIHKGAIFSLVYGKAATGFKEGSVGFVPAEIAKKARGK